MNTIVITIRPDRLEAFMKDLPVTEHSQVIALSGVHGERLDLKQIPSKLPLHNKLTRGEVGCYLSHMCVWKQIVQNQQPALIVEDDAILDTSTLQQIRDLYQRIVTMDPDWDVIQVGRNERFLRNVRVFQDNIAVPGRSWGLAAYYVSPKGARRLLATAMPIQCAVDIYVSTIRPIKHVWAATKNLVTLRKVHSDTFNIK